MYDLKPISQQAIPRALQKAERYRLLNEPRQAESICRDVLAADPANQDAVIILLLSVTDQFGRIATTTLQHAEAVLEQVASEYARQYYAGVISERWAKAQMGLNVPGHVVYHWLRRAMDYYERAQELAERGNDDATLRWNTCARMINQDAGIRPRAEDVEMQAGFEDEVPFR